MQCLLAWRVVGSEVVRDARLRLLVPQRVVDDHDVQALARLRAADMLLDQIGGQMRRTRPARAGQTIAIDDEDLVGNRLQTVELLERSEEHTSELQSLMRISYAVFLLTKQTQHELLGVNVDLRDAPQTDK